MSSLMTALEESPSTICSHSRYSYTTNYSHHATEFSTPRDQVRIACLEHTMPLSSPLSACNVDNNNNSSTCLSDIDEWLEHSNKFCKSSIHLTESVHSGQSGSPEEEDSRLSAICSTYLAAQEHELHNITLPCVREDSSVFQGQSCISCTCKPPKFGGYERTRLMGPYDEFLDDIRRRKQEAERDARKKAKHVELILKLRRKENALNDWELQQTRKAMDKMDKIQAFISLEKIEGKAQASTDFTRLNRLLYIGRVHHPSNAVKELERKQFKASARTQKKICLVREKAEKQKLKLRRSAMKRFQQIQTSKTRSPSEISWGSRLPLC
ncbi:hypothetical protein JHK82_018175 [Glycine max]|uniref:Remorin C-terminal domain-containing protein n=1 Tax=Glycine soja TaxID=3848 RepID=A0A0B2QU63_GLYSO|nr:hypothetical protein JHK87_018065 [Glycine soja]KAG5022257.1 hypothetical protein JHK85_018599 [Glycine max]KAG5037360.1 hypothetical protein JHK86_018200 [Glycine max]KAG5142434.1 hypothetical protein JHK82_018129 [Glycine max]KAG5142480.1 hypothetical protein JHK82_018175 [Glycine max]